MSLDNIRQPQPVKVTYEGDPRDVQRYMQDYRRRIEQGSYDNVVVHNETSMIIYPRAIND